MASSNLIESNGKIAERVAVYKENLRAAVAIVDKLDDAVELSKRIKLFQEYAKEANKGLEMLNDIAELKIAAERQCGKMLTEMSLHGGDRRSSSSSTRLTLNDLNVSKDRSHKWQKMAKIPEEEFDRYCKSMRESSREITQSGFLRLKYRQEDSPRDHLDFKCPVCGLRSNRCIATGKVLARTKSRVRKCLHCGYHMKTWELVIDPNNPPFVPIVHLGPKPDVQKD